MVGDELPAVVAVHGGVGAVGVVDGAVELGADEVAMFVSGGVAGEDSG